MKTNQKVYTRKSDRNGTIYENDVYQCEARKQFARALLKRGHPVTQKALKALIALTKQDSEEDNHG